MLDIYNYVVKLTENNFVPILVLDIDDTCISTQHGKKLVDNDVTILVNYVFEISPDNLWFLTAREYEYHNKTNHKLNKVGLLHKGKYIKYNIIHSPYNKHNEVTKGTTLINNIINKVEKCENNWFIIVDDDIEQLNDMCAKLQNETINYTLFHFSK
jgi:hypothetical protein